MHSLIIYGLGLGVIHEKQARLEALDAERAELVASIAVLQSELKALDIEPLEYTSEEFAARHSDSTTENKEN
ncbi:hypothetical protein [Microbacterium enclense]|uniref:hypothetical protein n=1 Tax=Microbacterium enclense TaxID=993073 RepID=UPI003F810B0C